MRETASEEFVQGINTYGDAWLRIHLGHFCDGVPLFRIHRRDILLEYFIDPTVLLQQLSVLRAEIWATKILSAVTQAERLVAPYYHPP